MFERECILCKKRFLNRSNNVYVCKDEHIVNCSYCHKKFILREQQKSRIKPGNPQFNLEFYCSRTCQAKGKSDQIHTKEAEDKRVKTRLEKYGTYLDMEKVKKTNLKRYGSEYTVTSSEIKKKIEDKFIEKYGQPYFYGSKEFIEKSKQTKLEKYNLDSYNNVEKQKETMIKRYGVDNPLKLEKIKEQIKNTNMKRYGKPYLMQSKKIKDIAKEKCIEKYGVEYNCLTDQCIEKQNNTISQRNLKFANLLKEIGLDIELEYKLKLKRYDLHIKGTNILIEINPTYTHNVTKRPIFKGKEVKQISKDYHYQKSKLAQENNYRCIHIWDWDNLSKIIELLKPKEKLYGRRLKIKEVTKQEANNFLDQYHLQNHSIGNTINIALIKEEEIIQIMTFGKPRYNKNYEYELLRLCTNSNYQVIGGSEKIFKYFLKTYKPLSIISYCDNSKFIGEVYSKLGFTLFKNNKPSKHWYNIQTDTHITNNLLKQRGFDQLLGDIYGSYGKGTSNEELMKEHNFVEIYDCGQSTWIYQSIN